jgi:hypothetical protein
MAEVEKKKFTVGEMVTIFSTNLCGKVEKITGDFVKVEGVGVKHKDNIIAQGTIVFRAKKTIVTAGDLIGFMKDIPKEIHEVDPPLELNYPEEMEDHFDGFHELDDWECDDDEYEENNDRLSALMQWADNITEGTVLDTILWVKDQDGFKTHMVIDITATDIRAKIHISLEYNSTPVHFLEDMTEIESKVATWFDKNPLLEESMMNGAHYRLSSLNNERPKIKVTSRTLLEVEVADKLVKQCLLIWPESNFNFSKAESVLSLLHESKLDEGVIKRLEILLELIKSKGINQPDFNSNSLEKRSLLI